MRQAISRDTGIRYTSSNEYRSPISCQGSRAMSCSGLSDS
jgi:hypothetical protein